MKKYFAFFISILICILFFNCNKKLAPKINGISFVASNKTVNNEQILPIVNMHANWVTLMPFAFMKTINDTTIAFNSKYQWKGEREEGIKETASLFKAQKIKIMLKPQIWIPNGGFTGQIMMHNEKEWLALEKNYRSFLLFYAHIAEENQMEMLCIGTELASFVAARPQFWQQLIKDVKMIYHGQLTYAENWDAYDKVSFIAELDYIGVDAYFPLSNSQTPAVTELRASWQPVKDKLKLLARQTGKPVLFTEYGYQSKDFTTDKPWEFHKESNVNLVAQQNALEALYLEFWKEKWFAGGFIWKWYDHENAGGLQDTDYTMQNKPAQKIVSKYYKQSTSH